MKTMTSNQKSIKNFTRILCICVIFFFQSKEIYADKLNIPCMNSYNSCISLCPIVSYSANGWPYREPGCVYKCDKAYELCMSGTPGPGPGPGPGGWVVRFTPDWQSYQVVAPSPITLYAGRWNNIFLLSQGNVTAVNFYSVTRTLLLSTVPVDSVEWNLIGAGTFNSSTGMWQTTWNIPITSDTSGYIMAAQFFDSSVPGGKSYALSFALPVMPGTLTAIPTLSQWGLIIFILMLLSVGMLFVQRRQNALVLAGNVTQDVKPSLFNRRLYMNVLGIVLLIAVSSLAVAYWYFGTLSITDSLGTLVSAGLIAYMVQLWLLSRRK